MDNFGQFLYSLRKEKGMTQAELAEALGVTNKAVSKWETDEAMPETSLLLPLSRIFDITVDELLDGKRKEKPVAAENANKSENDIKDSNFGDMYDKDKDDEVEDKTLLDKIKDLVCACIIFVGLAVYLFLGTRYGTWHPNWIIIVVCALVCGLVGITFDLCNKEKSERKIRRGENPYTGAICGFIMIVCVIVYLVLGSILNLWHPLWIIPAFGAFVCALVGIIGEIFTLKKKK